MPFVVETRIGVEGTVSRRRWRITKRPSVTRKIVDFRTKDFVRSLDAYRTTRRVLVFDTTPEFGVHATRDTVYSVGNGGRSLLAISVWPTRVNSRPAATPGSSDYIIREYRARVCETRRDRIGPARRRSFGSRTRLCTVGRETFVRLVHA